MKLIPFETRIVSLSENLGRERERERDRVIERKRCDGSADYKTQLATGHFLSKFLKWPLKIWTSQDSTVQMADQIRWPTKLKLLTDHINYVVLFCTLVQC